MADRGQKKQENGAVFTPEDERKLLAPYMEALAVMMNAEDGDVLLDSHPLQRLEEHDISIICVCAPGPEYTSCPAIWVDNH